VRIIIVQPDGHLKVVKYLVSVGANISAKK